MVYVHFHYIKDLKKEKLKNPLLARKYQNPLHFSPKSAGFWRFKKPRPLGKRAGRTNQFVWKFWVRIIKNSCGIKTATNFWYYFTEFNPQIQETKPDPTNSPPPQAAG